MCALFALGQILGMVPEQFNFVRRMATKKHYTNLFGAWSVDRTMLCLRHESIVRGITAGVCGTFLGLCDWVSYLYPTDLVFFSMRAH